jgi:hypothetical protein
MLQQQSDREPDRVLSSFGYRGLATIVCLTWTFWFVAAAIRLSKTVYSLGLPEEQPIAINEYLDFINRFWSGTPLYIPGDLHGFHYFPIMLIIGTPLSWMNLQVAGGLFGLVSAGFFTFSVYYLAQQIWPRHPAVAAGIVLAVSAKAAVVSLWLLQMQMPMTAAMLCSSVALMKAQLRAAVLWLILAVALKPLAIVMVLLAAFTIPQTRIRLLVGILVLLFVPFAFRGWNYLATEYFNYVRQLSHITEAAPGIWQNQADISTLLNWLGVDVSAHVRLAMRLGAALVSLALAWRVATYGDARASGFALLILATCYVGLFNPRQETVSFLLVVPVVTMLGLCFLRRDWRDWRGWIWIVLALILSAKRVDADGTWVLPGVMVVVWTGLLGVMLNLRRWCMLLCEESTAGSSTALLPTQEI